MCEVGFVLRSWERKRKFLKSPNDSCRTAESSRTEPRAIGPSHDEPDPFSLAQQPSSCQRRKKRRCSVLPYAFIPVWCGTWDFPLWDITKYFYFFYFYVCLSGFVLTALMSFQIKHRDQSAGKPHKQISPSLSSEDDCYLHPVSFSFSAASVAASESYEKHSNQSGWTDLSFISDGKVLQTGWKCCRSTLEALLCSCYLR